MKLSERVTLFYLSGIILLEIASLEGILEAGAGTPIIRTVWLSSFALLLNSIGVGWAAWLGWFTKAVASEFRLIFKVIALADVVLFVIICVLPSTAK